MKIRYLVLIVVLGLGVIGLSVPATYAIGEVTTTPEPVQPTLVPTATPRPLPTPVLPTTNDREAQLGEASDLLNQGDFEGALALLDDLILREPDYDSAYVFRGITLVQLGRLQRALDDFSRAIELLDYDWTYHLLRADTYVQLGQFGDALLDYNRSIELNPRFQQAFRNRGRLNAQLGNTAESETDTEINSAIERRNFGDFMGAIQALETALTLGSREPLTLASIHYNIGLTYSMMGDEESAIVGYSAAAEALPTMHDAYLARGISRRLTGDLQGAGVDFIRRIEILERNTVSESLNIGDSREVTMAYGNVFRYTFTGRAGQSVTLAARDVELVSVDPLISLLGPDGAALAGDDDLGGELDALIENFTLPADGTYTLVVSHANGGYDGLVRVSITTP